MRGDHIPSLGLGAAFSWGLAGSGAGSSILHGRGSAIFVKEERNEMACLGLFSAQQF